MTKYALDDSEFEFDRDTITLTTATSTAIVTIGDHGIRVQTPAEEFDITADPVGMLTMITRMSHRNAEIPLKLALPGGADAVLTTAQQWILHFHPGVRSLRERHRSLEVPEHLTPRLSLALRAQHPRATASQYWNLPVGANLAKSFASGLLIETPSIVRLVERRIGMAGLLVERAPDLAHEILAVGFQPGFADDTPRAGVRDVLSDLSPRVACDVLKLAVGNSRGANRLNAAASLGVRVHGTDPRKVWRQLLAAVHEGGYGRPLNFVEAVEAFGVAGHPARRLTSQADLDAVARQHHNCIATRAHGWPTRILVTKDVIAIAIGQDDSIGVAAICARSGVVLEAKGPRNAQMPSTITSALGETVRAYGLPG